MYNLIFFVEVIAYQDDIHIRKEEEGNIIMKGLGMLSIEKVGHTAIRIRRCNGRKIIIPQIPLNLILFW